MLKLDKYIANPDIYDYHHFFHLNTENDFAFLVGGGQTINLDGYAKYWINKLLDDKFDFELVLYDIKFGEPYLYNFDISKYEIPKKSKFRVEQGKFAFTGDNPFLTNERDRPLSFFHERLIFESDPLFFFEEQYDNTPFGRSTYVGVRRKRMLESELIYYHDVITTTIGEVTDAGKVPGKKCDEV